MAGISALTTLFVSLLPGQVATAAPAPRAVPVARPAR
jgi:hypothetical protein